MNWNHSIGGWSAAIGVVAVCLYALVKGIIWVANYELPKVAAPLFEPGNIVQHKNSGRKLTIVRSYCIHSYKRSCKYKARSHETLSITWYKEWELEK